MPDHGGVREGERDGQKVPVPKEAGAGFEIGLQDLKYGLEAELNARIVNKRRRRF